MKKTFYAINRFGSLIFDLGEEPYIIDGVSPHDVEGLQYIRACIRFPEELHLPLIESQLIFTNVRNTAKG
jgi:hypothetical protein